MRPAAGGPPDPSRQVERASRPAAHSATVAPSVHSNQRATNTAHAGPATSGGQRRQQDQGEAIGRRDREHRAERTQGADARFCDGGSFAAGGRAASRG